MSSERAVVCGHVTRPPRNSNLAVVSPRTGTAEADRDERARRPPGDLSARARADRHAAQVAGDRLRGAFFLGGAPARGRQRPRRHRRRRREADARPCPLSSSRRSRSFLGRCGVSSQLGVVCASSGCWRGVVSRGILNPGSRSGCRATSRCSACRTPRSGPSAARRRGGVTWRVRRIVSLRTTTSHRRGLVRGDAHALAGAAAPRRGSEFGMTLWHVSGDLSSLPLPSPPPPPSRCNCDDAAAAAPRRERDVRRLPARRWQHLGHARRREPDRRLARGAA